MHHEPVFDMYGIAPPDGDWAYQVDDTGITFGPGWWPFYRDGRPASVRLAPDSTYQSWRNEYVLVFPRERATADAKVHLYVRPQGMGAMTVLTWIHLALRERTFQLDPGLPANLHEQAAGKASRLLDLLRVSRLARRRGAAQPITAHEVWAARQEAK